MSKANWKTYRVHYLNCEGTKIFADILAADAASARKAIEEDDGELDETVKVLDVEEIFEQ